MGNWRKNNWNVGPRILLAAVFLCSQILIPNPRLEAASPVTGGPEDLIIVVNKANKRNSITLAELREYFLRKRHTWGPGQKSVPIHAKSTTRVREAFNRTVLNMSVNEELQYWQNRKIKFGDSSIVEFGNNLKAVFKIKGSISYVFRSDYKEGVVKVLLVIPAD